MKIATHICDMCKAQGFQTVPDGINGVEVTTFLLTKLIHSGGYKPTKDKYTQVDLCKKCEVIVLERIECLLGNQNSLNVLGTKLKNATAMLQDILKDYEMGGRHVDIIEISNMLESLK